MRLRKQVYIYFSSYFINAGLSFLIVSLLTHHLTTYDYGIINLYSSFLLLLMPFVSAGILFPISVEFFKKPADEYKRFFTNAQALSLLSLVLFTVLCLLFQQPLSRFLKVSPVWICIMPVTVWWIMINETTMLITRNKNSPFQFALFTVGKTLAEIGLTVLLVLGLNWAWEGRLLSAALAPVILGILSIYLFYRWKLLEKTVDWSGIRQVFLLSLPFVFERLAVFVLGNADKYFIDKFDLNGTTEVGLYGLGSQIASITYIVIVSLNNAYHPYLFKRMSEGWKGRLHKSTGWYIAACAITVGGIFIAIPILFNWFIGEEFHAARIYAYMLSGGYLMWGVYNALLGYLLYLGKNKQIFYISLMGMTASLVMNAIVVPLYGAKGAAITSITTYFLMAFICYLYVRKYFLLKHEQNP